MELRVFNDLENTKKRPTANVLTVGVASASIRAWAGYIVTAHVYFARRPVGLRPKNDGFGAKSIAKARMRWRSSGPANGATKTRGIGGAKCALDATKCEESWLMSCENLRYKI
jgi:hypothetical protein